jgi:hypothetical protein
MCVRVGALRWIRHPSFPRLSFIHWGQEIFYLNQITAYTDEFPGLMPYYVSSPYFLNYDLTHVGLSCWSSEGVCCWRDLVMVGLLLRLLVYAMMVSQEKS